MRPKLLVGSITVLFVVALILATRFSQTVRAESCRLVSLDVGQGDAILLRTPDQQDVLVDAGPGKRVIDALDRQLPLGDNDIELIALTHPDADHIGGAASVFDRYQVLSILDTGVTADTETDRLRRQRALEEGSEYHLGRSGEVFQIGAYLKLRVLWPSKQWLSSENSSSDRNDTSLVILAECLGSRVLLTGDASTVVEDELLKAGVDVRADVLKAGHHGSKTSTGSRFLIAVDPQTVVLSVGKNNRYGHPHVTLLERLKLRNVNVRRTDTEGDIVMTTDGNGGWR